MNAHVTRNYESVASRNACSGVRPSAAVCVLETFELWVECTPVSFSADACTSCTTVTLSGAIRFHAVPMLHSTHRTQRGFINHTCGTSLRSCKFAKETAADAASQRFISFVDLSHSCHRSSTGSPFPCRSLMSPANVLLVFSDCTIRLDNTERTNFECHQ